MWLQVVLPNVSVALCRRRTLVLLNPRQVHALHKVPDRQHTLGVHDAAVHRFHVTFRFPYDLGWRPLAARRHWTELVGYALLLDSSADVAALPITHVPAA